jgi:hypothetical protein
VTAGVAGAEHPPTRIAPTTIPSHLSLLIAAPDHAPSTEPAGPAPANIRRQDYTAQALADQAAVMGDRLMA